MGFGSRATPLKTRRVGAKPHVADPEVIRLYRLKIQSIQNMSGDTSLLFGSTFPKG